MLDGSVLEVFVGDEVVVVVVVVTERVYARADDRPVLTLACSGGAATVDVTCWAAAPPAPAAQPG